MSYTSRIRWSVPMLLAVSAACADATAPAPDIVNGRASFQGATVERGEGMFTFNRVHFWACVGERVHNVVAIPLTWQRVLLPNGDYIYHEIVPAAEGVGTITGLTSGHVWRRDVLAAPYIERSTGGGMTHWIYRGRFVSETGPTLEVREVFHVSANANGEITAQHHEVECRVASP